MKSIKAAFSGFSVNDIKKAKEFYTETLGLELDSEEMGLQVQLPEGGTVFIYEKPNHEPATFTILNFVVEDIDEAIEELKAAGISLEHYDDLGPDMKQDDKGVLRGLAANMGPDIAWFNDPAGNVLSVM